jgi:hypothetical protein
MQAGSSDGTPRSTTADTMAEGGRCKRGHPRDEGVDGAAVGIVMAMPVSARPGRIWGKTTPTGGSRLSATVAW